MLSPLYGQLSPLRVPSIAPPDADALAYIASVEAADGQTLEEGVAKAFSDFIVGCKSDGIWSAIKASCILAGARTLSGALVPLVGTAPTNNNFVSADYNRETGLIGNATTKYLNSNRAADADPQNNAHHSIWVSNASSGTNWYYFGSGKTTPTPVVYDRIITNIGFSIRNTATAPNTYRANTGFAGVARTSSNSYNWRWSGGTYTGVVTNDSVGTQSYKHYVFAANLNGTVSGRSNGRLSFYSIGESLDLALLDTRVSTLMTALAAAIP